MLAGLYRRYLKYEFSLALTDMSYSTFGAGDGAGFTALLTTSYSVDYLVQALGVELFHSYSETSLATTIVSSYRIPSIGASGSISSGSSSTLTFNDLDVYFDRTGVWYIKWSSIVWEVDGAVEATVGADSKWSVMASVPSAIPILGNCSIVTGSAAPLVGTLVGNGCGSYPGPWIHSGGDASCRAIGGFRVQDDLGWSGLRVVLPDDTTCLSHEVAIESPRVIDNPNAYVDDTSDSGWQMAYPGHEDERGHFRMNDGFEELVSRGEIPKVPHRVRTISSYTPCSPPLAPAVITVNTTVDTDGYPARSQFLSTVTDGTHVIEQPCSMRAMAPFERSFLHSKTGPPGDSTLDWVVTSLGENYTNGLFPTPAYSHPEWQSVITNTILSPHWSYWPWFPPDSASSSDRWDLAGSDSDIDYWHQIRQQHVTNPSLPSGEDTRHRVNCVSDLITQNGHKGFSQSVLGLPCFWGLSRFSVDEEERPTEFTTNEDSEPRYSFKDGGSPGTGSVDAGGIELTTGDAIEFELASYTAFPMMAPTLADRITLPTITNCSSFVALAVGSDGTTKQIATSAGTFRIPFGDAVKWATDAVREFGAGYISDSYDTLAADDDSSATFSDELSTSSGGLLPGFSPVKIRIEIVKANPLLPSEMDHLTFHMAPWADAKVFHETGRISTVVFKDGPAVRFGALQFYDYGLDTPLSTPLVASLSLAPTIGDLWAWQNCFLNGVDALTDLSTRMNAEFVSGEECTIIDHLWRDPDSQIITMSFIANSEIGPVMCYSNSYRELPPTATMPVRRRESSTGWKATGDFGMFSYELCESKHPVIVPGSTPPHLGNPADILSDEDAPTGWTVRTFSLAVDNNEGYDWTLRWNGVDYYKMRPWRGTFNLLAPLPTVGGALVYDVLQNWRHTIGEVKDGTVWLSFSGSNKPYVFESIDTGTTADFLDMAYHDGSGRLYYLASDGSDINLYKTTDEGQSSTLVMNLGSGDYSAFEWTANNLAFVYRLDGSGDLYCRVLDANEDTVISEAVTNLTGLDQAQFDVRVSVNADQKQVIGIAYKFAGDRYFKTSVDGFNFS